MSNPVLAVGFLNDWAEEVFERIKNSQILGNGIKFRNVLDILWVWQHKPNVNVSLSNGRIQNSSLLTLNFILVHYPEWSNVGNAP